MASSFAATALSLFSLLLVLTTFLPLLTAQPPPPPPPSPYVQPDRIFHGWDIRSFVLDPRGPYALINDHGSFIHGLDLVRGGREEFFYTNPDRDIQAVSMSRRGNPIVATSQLLIFFDSQWQPRFNVSLRSLDRRVGYWLSASILVDSNDYLYLLGFNATNYFVNILDAQGVWRDSWMLPGRPLSPTWAMDAANNIYVQERMGNDRPLLVFSSGGVLTDTLRFNSSGVGSIDGIAVASNGDIYLTARQAGATTLLTFNAALRPRAQFNLATVADSINQLAFDGFDNLWVLDSQGDNVLAFAGNGLIGTLSSDAPSLYGLTSLQYDGSSDSLLFTTYFSSPVAVRRISGRDGGLVQQLSVPDRLNNCWGLNMAVTGDGSIWLLLHCYTSNYVTETRVHVMTRAGRIQREFPLSGPASSIDFVVDPYADRMFVLWSTGFFPFPQFDYIVGYSLDGSPRVNVSLDTLYPAVKDIHSMTVAFGALHVLENDRNRVSWYDIGNGSLVGSTYFPDGIYPTALAADRQGWFIAIYDEIFDGRRRTYNSSVMHFDRAGQPLGQYVMGPQTGGSVFGRLVVNDDGSRLYGFDEIYGTIAVWQIRRGPPPAEVTAAATEAGEEASAAVERIYPTSVMSGKGADESNAEVLASLKTLRRRQAAPFASM